MTEINYVRLPIKNAFNIRDLGGYPCVPAGVTRWHAFLRGDDLSLLDPDDIRFLTDYGVRTVIDLRSGTEIKRAPDPFMKHPSVDYHNLPLNAGAIPDLTQSKPEVPEDFIPRFYLEILKKETKEIKRLMETIAVAKPGCVLFHCSAGKDRTGMVAMLLLGLAGVALPDIISNYEVTYTYIRQNPVTKKLSQMYPIETMLSKVEYLDQALAFIDESFGSMYAYLLSCGIEKDTLSQIQKRFVLTTDSSLGTVHE